MLCAWLEQDTPDIITTKYCFNSVKRPDMTKTCLLICKTATQKVETQQQQKTRANADAVCIKGMQPQEIYK